MLKTKVSPFEFKILKQLKALDLDWSRQRLLVASSGGRDSVVLLSVLTALQSRLKFELEVAHVHHGPSSEKKVRSYRALASKAAKEQAEVLGHKFTLIKHSGAPLKSEADFRKVRETFLEKHRLKSRCNLIAFAHHSDDLFETRLIRLVRGTGSQGLQAMAICHEQKLRPLLATDSSQIEQYAKDRKLKWLEDPTNSEDHFFRNWIRNTWLPLLEEKRAGSRQSFARSLENLSDALLVSRPIKHEGQKTRLEVIKRKEFAVLTVIQKREVLARIMLDRGARDFSRRQLDEILKRLSSHSGVNRRKLSFEVGGLQWLVNAEQIEAVRL